jgi:tight adherence protein C
MQISFTVLLLIIACLAFLSAWLLVNRVVKLQDKQINKERIKARIGLASKYSKEKTIYTGCWWCTLGRAIGPKNRKEIDILQQQLVSAGFRQEQHIGAYFFIKYSALLGSLLIMVLAWSWFNAPVIWIIIVPVVFLLIPERVLIYFGQTRLQKVSEHLPDFLDMCNICMNAGLSYLVALKRVSLELKEVHPEICFEFEYLLDQIQIGVARQEALRQFAQRNPTQDIQTLIQVLIQN